MVFNFINSVISQQFVLGKFVFQPVAFELFGFAVRWYSLSYIAGFLLGYLLLGYILKHTEPVDSLRGAKLDDLIFFSILGVILGGRLGYILIYAPGYYLRHPLEILSVWNGGMSFHGGLLGVLLATLYFSRSRKIEFFTILDLLAIIAPIGLFLGRLANFVNAELYGRATDKFWGVTFPTDELAISRHPSQLYEAFSEGLLLFLVQMVILFGFRKFFKSRVKVGLHSAIFALGYGVSRFVVEFFREPDANIGYIAEVFTMGQLLSLPLIFAGAIVLFLLVKRREI